MEFWQDRALMGTGCILYGLAFVYAFVAVVRRWEHRNFIFLALLAGGFTFQSFGLYVRGLELGSFPLTNTFEVFQVIAWCAVGLNFALRQLFKLRLLNFFSSAFAFGLAFISLGVGAWDNASPPPTITGSPWVEFHAALAVLSYGIFAVLALTSLMYLMQDRALTEKRTGRWFSLLPAIRQLETVNIKLIGLGVSLLTVSVAIGALNWMQAPGAVGLVKLVIAVAVWLAYLVVMILRRRRKLLARRFAQVCVVLFVVALISLWPLTQRSADFPVANGAGFVNDARQ